MLSKILNKEKIKKNNCLAACETLRNKYSKILAKSFLLAVILTAVLIPTSTNAITQQPDGSISLDVIQQNLDRENANKQTLFGDANNYITKRITLDSNDLTPQAKYKASVIQAKITDLENYKNYRNQNDALYNDPNNYVRDPASKKYENLNENAKETADNIYATLIPLQNKIVKGVYDTRAADNVYGDLIGGAYGPSEALLDEADLTVGVDDTPLNRAPGNSGYCVIWDWTWGLTGPRQLSPDANLENCFSQFFYLVLYIFSTLIGLAGKFLNVVIEYTLVNMKTHLGEIGAIDTAWMAIRDLVNISFIFILLYIAIQTILGVGEHGVKHVLVKLIIVAMLINFSMFFTKVVIDATNMLAFEFYTKIQPANGGGFGDAVMNTFRLQTIYSPGNQYGNVNARNFAQGEHPFIVFVMGIILIIVALGVVLGGSMIFIKRYTTLIMLLIIAPIGFAGMILHKTEHYAEEWWNKLLAEAMAAPVFMIMMWLVFSIVNSSEFKNSVGLAKSSGSLSTDLDNMMFADGASNETVAGIILNFAIVISLFSAVLIACEKIGASGAGAAMKIAGGVKGAFAAGGVALGAAGFRNTVGRWARNAIEKTEFGTQDIRRWAATGNIAQRFLATNADKFLTATANLKVGGMKSHVDDIEEEKAALKRYLYEIRHDPDAIAETLGGNALGPEGMRYSPKKVATQQVWEDMSHDDQAEVIKHFKYGIEDIEKELQEKSKLPQTDQTKKKGEELTKKRNHHQEMKEALEGRLSAEEKELVDRKVENESLQIDRIRMNKFMEDGKKSGDYSKAIDLFKHMNTEQRVNLDPDVFVDKVFDGLRAQNDYEQFQRKRATSEKYVERLAEDIENQLNSIIQRSKNDELAKDDPETKRKLAELKRLVSGIEKNSDRYYGNGDLAKKAREEIAAMEKRNIKGESGGSGI